MKMLETPKFVGFGKKKRDDIRIQIQEEYFGNSREDKAYNTIEHIACS
jgi:hypothetical protein